MWGAECDFAPQVNIICSKIRLDFGGVSLAELIDITMGELLKRTAAKYPSRTAIEFLGRIWTWEEVDRASDDLAKGLLAHGVYKGCHVGIFAPDRPSFIIFMMAIVKTGAVAVLINPMLGSNELEVLLRNSDVEYLGVGTCHKNRDLRETVRGLSPLPLLKETIFIGDTLDDSEEAQKLVRDGLEYEKTTEGRDCLAKAAAEVKPSDIATILFTSGTTGTPKAVLITHHSRVNNAILQAEDLRATCEDRFCVAIPMFHCFCLSATVLAALSVGATICLPENNRTANVMKVLSEQRCTVFNAVPTLFFALMARPDFSEYDISALRIGIIGGAGYTPEQFKRIERSFGFRLLSSLGMTEATGGVTITDPEDSIEVRSTTVGHFMKHTYGVILDLKTGEELPPMKEGEICLSGYLVMKGYYKQPELTRQAIDEQGRLHTGDMGYLDHDGNLHMTGRIKELIIRGGENISPVQIETYLLQHDRRIERVKVIGIPDEHYGEEICACVILRQGETMSEEEVRDIIRRNLAPYKVPRYVLFFDSFPTSSQGKVIIGELQSAALSRLKGR